MITAERTASYTRPATPGKQIRVYMLDLLPTVPYYTGYLCAALSEIDHLQVDVGSANYYLDQSFFTRRGIERDGKLIDAVSRLPKIPAIGRRVLKVAEYLTNLSTLLARFQMNPPDVLHVQFLPMLKSSLPAELWFLRRVKRMGDTLGGRSTERDREPNG